MASGAIPSPPVQKPPTSYNLNLSRPANLGSGSGLNLRLGLEFKSLSLKDALNLLAKKSNITIKQLNLRKTIPMSGTMENASVREILDLIAQTYVLEWKEMSDGSVEVKPFRK